MFVFGFQAENAAKDPALYWLVLPLGSLNVLDVC